MDEPRTLSICAHHEPEFVAVGQVSICPLCQRRPGHREFVPFAWYEAAEAQSEPDDLAVPVATIAELLHQLLCAGDRELSLSEITVRLWAAADTER